MNAASVNKCTVTKLKIAQRMISLARLTLFPFRSLCLSGVIVRFVSMWLHGQPFRLGIVHSGIKLWFVFKGDQTRDWYPAGLYLFPPPAKRQFRVGNNVWVGQKLSMACKKDAPAHHTLKQGQPHEHKIDKHFQHKTDTCFTCTVRHHWKTTCKNRNRFVVLTLFRLRFKMLCLALWFSRRWV